MEESSDESVASEVAVTEPGAVSAIAAVEVRDAGVGAAACVVVSAAVRASAGAVLPGVARVVENVAADALGAAVGFTGCLSDCAGRRSVLSECAETAIGGESEPQSAALDILRTRRD